MNSRQEIINTSKNTLSVIKQIREGGYPVARAYVDNNLSEIYKTKARQYNYARALVKSAKNAEWIKKPYFIHRGICWTLTHSYEWDTNSYRFTYLPMFGKDHGSCSDDMDKIMREKQNDE